MVLLSYDVPVTLTGMWLAGMLTSGDLFLWNKDTDLFKTSSPVPDVIHQLTAAKGIMCVYVCGCLSVYLVIVCFSVGLFPGASPSIKLFMLYSCVA